MIITLGETTASESNKMLFQAVNSVFHDVGDGIGLSLILCLDHAPDHPPLVAVERRQDEEMVVTTPGPVHAHFLGK